MKNKNVILPVVILTAALVVASIEYVMVNRVPKVDKVTMEGYGKTIADAHEDAVSGLHKKYSTWDVVEENYEYPNTNMVECILVVNHVK